MTARMKSTTARTNLGTASYMRNIGEMLTYASLQKERSTTWAVVTEKEAMDNGQLYEVGTFNAI